MVVYAIKNHQGQWYRRQGRGGNGKCWVDELGEASVWLKTNGTSNIISYFAKAHKNQPVPLLVRLEARVVEEIDQTEKYRGRAKQRETAELEIELELTQDQIKANAEALRAATAKRTRLLKKLRKT